MDALRLSENCFCTRNGVPEEHRVYEVGDIVQQDNVLQLSPPLTITLQQLKQAIGIVDAAVAKATGK